MELKRFALWQRAATSAALLSDHRGIETHVLQLAAIPALRSSYRTIVELKRFRLASAARPGRPSYRTIVELKPPRMAQPAWLSDGGSQLRQVLCAVRLLADHHRVGQMRTDLCTISPHAGATGRKVVDMFACLQEDGHRLLKSHFEWLIPDSGRKILTLGQ